VTQPYENHNGGRLRSPLDGYLYIGMARGSGGDRSRWDRTCRVLGKLLRIDVETGNPLTYTIPSPSFHSDRWI